MSPQATAEIWRFMLDIDWYANARVLAAARRPRALHAACERLAARGYRMGDSLWVRLVDVGRALSGRSYANDGTHRLRRARLRCARGTRAAGSSKEAPRRARTPPPIWRSTSATLGSAYLGAVSFAQLRDGLRLEELSDGAVQRADAIFGWRPLPWCPEIF